MISALRGPNWLGVKVTFRVQLAPAPRLEPHVLLWSKSVALEPVIVTPLRASSEPPVLVSVSTCWLLWVAITQTPKLRVAGTAFRVAGVGGGDGCDPLPQPLNQDNPPNTIAKCFFTVPPTRNASVHRPAGFSAPIRPGIKAEPRLPNGPRARRAIVG